MELRRTPLYDRHRSLGARMVEFAGWEMPVQYAGVMQEHRAVRQRVGLFDVSHMGEIRVEGPEAEAFLHHLTPNDVAALTPGRAHYSGLLNDSGGYLDDLLVYRLEPEAFMLVVNAENRERDLHWIQGHAPEGAAVTDVSEETALLAVQGPQSLAILRGVSEVGVEEIGYYRFVRGRVAGRTALISRTGYTGENGFELYLTPETAGEVWDRLLEVGRSDGIQPAGLGARDTLRLEAGMALYGHELDESTTPWEAGLEWVVKLEKGEFVGRDALLRQRDDGLQRRLIGFQIEGRGIARQGHSVHRGDRPIGRVTSGTFSPTFEKGIGMAYVDTESAQRLGGVELEVRGRRLPGSLQKLPLYRRD